MFADSSAGEVVFVDDVNARIDNDAAQQYERGKPTLVESELKEVKRQKHPDKRNGNHDDDHERLPERLEENGADKVNNGNH